MEKKYVVTKDEPYGLVSLQIDDGDVHAFGGIPSIQKFRAEDCPDLPEAIFHELLARDGGFILQQSENGWKAENTRFASYTLPDSF